MEAEDKEILNDYLSKINKTSKLTDEQFASLYERYKNGDKEAKNLLIKKNLKFVVMIAKRYKNLGLTMMDLIEEGNIGLIKAVEKYDIKKGTKFSTYAVWWIKQKIKRALDNQVSLIRTPSYAVQNARKCLNYWDEINKDNNSGINLNETSIDLGLTIRELKNVMYSINSNKVVSLDSALQTDSDASLIDLIEEKNDSNIPEKSLEKKMNQNMLSELFNILTDKEKLIIEARFELNNNVKETLTEIGEKLGISRERVRQIENIAIQKMKKFFIKNFS